MTFIKTSLKLTINLLLDNCYFGFNSICVSKLIEISMEPGPVPCMKNLYFCYDEKMDFSNKKIGPTKGEKIFRFLDDDALLTMMGLNVVLLSLFLPFNRSP